MLGKTKECKKSKEFMSVEIILFKLSVEVTYNIKKKRRIYRNSSETENSLMKEETEEGGGR